jgi:glycosyltransferase involved in cell wall biosynthesis
MAMSLTKYWSVNVVEFYGPEKSEGNERITENIRVKSCSRPRWWPENNLVKAIIFFFKVFPVLIKAKADVYHCSGFDALIICVPIKILTGKKLVYDCFEHYPYQFAASEKTVHHSITSGFILCLENALAKLSDYVLVVPSYDNILLERFKKYKKDSTSVIWNLPPINLLDKKKPINRTGRDKIILYVGGITEDKGALKLLEAASRVVVEVPDVKVVMIGPTNIRQKLSERSKGLGIEKNLEVLKPVPYFDVWKVYNRADISIILYQPTFWTLRTMASEKLFESMLFSLPVVVSNFPGLREIVETCNSGILVDPTNSEEISKGITHLLKDSSLSIMLGRNGRDAVLRRYNWEVEEPELINIYSNLLRSEK